MQATKAPSEIRPDVDPVVERVIQRCLEHEPRMRPASVAQLALSLPGGDPLAAALAAGETPSPEMVAASGSKEGLRPAIAMGILISVIVGALGATAFGEWMVQRRGVQFGKSPAFLVEHAPEFLRKVGYTEFADSASGYELPPFTDSPGNIPPNEFRGLELRGPVFWYRQSPRPLIPVNSNTVTNGVSADDPRLQFPGEVLAVLNTEGDLLALHAVPSESETAEAQPAVDWASLFSAAGLDLSRSTSVDVLFRGQARRMDGIAEGTSGRPGSR